MQFEELSNYVIEGNAKGAEAWTGKAVAEGVPPLTIVTEGLVPGMDVVGLKFKANEYYLPEVLVSARAMKTSMALLRPLLAESEASTRQRVVIGTVKGDLHDIGKNLVSMMMEGAGFDVMDLGVDVEPEAFVKAVEEHKPDMLCLSALLTTTKQMMETTIRLIEEAELRQTVKVIVGGAPVTAKYAVDIGADGYAAEAASAAELARELLAVPSS